MRPRRVGEILDAAIKIYIRNARTLMGLTAVVVIPMRVLAGIVLLSTLPAGSDVPGGTFAVSSSSQPVTDLWMLWDREKQCWHDKTANSVVVPEPAYPVN